MKQNIYIKIYRDGKPDYKAMYGYKTKTLAIKAFKNFDYWLVNNKWPSPEL